MFLTVRKDSTSEQTGFEDSSDETTEVTPAAEDPLTAEVRAIRDQLTELQRALDRLTRDLPA